MKSASVFMLFFLWMSLLSCQDIKDIVVSGQILDRVTNKPIANAEVVVLCWYATSMDDVSYEKKNVFTNNKGFYSVRFEKGHNIDIASKSNGYNPARNYVKLSTNKVLIDLKLTAIQKNSTVLLKNNTENVIAGDIPFLGVRIYADTSTEKLNFNTAETIGFDLKNFKSTVDTVEADFWFKIEKKNGQPSIICTSKNGGIFPIKQEDEASSCLYEYAIAPASGYVTLYKLKSNENAFFILCRDGKTYGKLILEKTLIDKSIPDGKGSYYMEFGRQFECLYQPDGTRNLACPVDNINLESYLLKR